MSTLQWSIAAVPRIVVAGRFMLADRAHETRYQGGAHALHLHDYAGEMRLGGEARRVAPGDLTLSPAGVPSSYRLDAPGQHWCIHFTDDGSGRGGGEVGESISVPLQIAAGDLAQAAREQMAHVAALHGRARDSRAAGVAAALSLQLLLLDVAEGPSARPCVAERAATVIDARFAEPLDIAAIALAVGRNPAYLARVFQARYRVTLGHRLLQRRVEHARYLLEATDLPIWRVAERVGIADAQQFNKSVRRVLGASPTAIRARAAMQPIDPDR